MASQRRRGTARAPALPLLLALLSGGAIGLRAEPLFFPPSYFGMSGEQVFALAVADIDGANGPDLVAISYEGDSLSVFLGEPGGFAPRLNYWAGDGPTSIVAAQLDGDGLCDLATVGWDDTLRIFHGQGDGQFTPGARYATAGNPWELAAADLNGDQRVDLACSFAGDPVFQVWTNDGSAHFGSSEYATAGRCRGLALAQMDGAGGLDVVLAVFADDQLAVHLNTGGAFGPAIAYTTADKPYDLEALDFNLDGVDDLLLIHKDDARQIWGIPGLGGGYLGPPLVWNASYDMDQALLADLDDDDDLDLLVTSSSSGTVGVLLQPQDGDWPAPFFQEGGLGAYAPAAGDFDSDGDMDVVVSSYWTDQLARLDNRTYYVPVSVSDFAATTGPGRVDLSWHAASDGESFDFRVLVSTPDGERELDALPVAAGAWRAVDRDAALWSGGDFDYRLLSREGEGEWLHQRRITVRVPATAPARPTLLAPWPNPANPTFTAEFLLPASGRAVLELHDLRGRRVARLADGRFASGLQRVTWSGADLPSGVYLLSLRAEGVTASRRLVLLR